MSSSEAHIRAVANYRRKIKRLTIDFFLSEQDVYDWICSQESKQGYIKNLIKADMQKRQS